MKRLRCPQFILANFSRGVDCKTCNITAILTLQFCDIKGSVLQYLHFSTVILRVQYCNTLYFTTMILMAHFHWRVRVGSLRLGGVVKVRFGAAEAFPPTVPLW